MRFLNKKTQIDFMGKRHMALVGSVIVLVIAIASMPVLGLNFGPGLHRRHRSSKWAIPRHRIFLKFAVN